MGAVRTTARAAGETLVTTRGDGIVDARQPTCWRTIVKRRRRLRRGRPSGSRRQVRFLERFELYREAGSAFVIARTGETRRYGDVLVRKGLVAVVPTPGAADSSRKDRATLQAVLSAAVGCCRLLSAALCREGDEWRP